MCALQTLAAVPPSCRWPPLPRTLCRECSRLSLLSLYLGIVSPCGALINTCWSIRVPCVQWRTEFSHISRHSEVSGLGPATRRFHARKHRAMCRGVIFCSWKAVQVWIIPSRCHIFSAAQSSRIFLLHHRLTVWIMAPRHPHIAKSRKAVPNLPKPSGNKISNLTRCFGGCFSASFCPFTGGVFGVFFGPFL
jgi:hypothetical protein